ncbi:MAG TPA: winged helix DNA-binding domain-containing protein [Catenuloplanes sp.]
MAVATKVLTRRELNRATLHRQLLLRRHQLPVPAAIDQLMGLQAQETNPPYIGLWSRLADFQRDTLTRLMTDRLVVRGWTMRYTLHLLTAPDFVWVRQLLQPVLDRAQRSFCGSGTAGMDLGELAAVGRELLEEAPRTTLELRGLLARRYPGRDPASLAYSVQYLLPVVHVPPGGTWGRGRAVPSAVAEQWLGEPLTVEPTPDRLVMRYLAAFGPASVMDIQAWCGLTRLRASVERLRPHLRVFRDETGRELFDLPDAPRPDPDTPAPPRLLPDFDNLMVAFADRTRVLDEGHRKLISVGAGAIRASVLVDGFVRGAWGIRRARGTATLRVEPFAPISGPDRAALEEEALRLLAFAAADADAHVVTFD